MTNSPVFYQNNPTSGTQYWSHMWSGCVSSGENLSVTIQAWSGQNGSGNLVTTTSLKAIIWDQTSNVQRSSYTGYGDNAVTAATGSGTTNGHWFKCSAIYTGNAIGSLAMWLTYNTSAPFVPTTPSFSPSSGAVGTSVALTGSQFTDATFVNFNGVSAAFTFNNDTSITATVPSGATTGLVTVGNPAGSKNSSTSFTVSGSFVHQGFLRRAGAWAIPQSISPRRSNAWGTLTAWERRSGAWVQLW